MRPRPLPALAVVAASASLVGAGRLWFSALKSDRVVQSPPALHAPPLVVPSTPEPPLVVHAAPAPPPVTQPTKPVTKQVVRPRAHKAPAAKVTARAAGPVVVGILGEAASQAETRPVAPHPIVVAPLPQHPSGHVGAKPKPKPAKPPTSKPATPPQPPVAAPTPAPTPPATPTPTPPVSPPVTPPAPPSATPPSPPVVVAQNPPMVTQTPPTPPAVQAPTPPVVQAPTPPVVQAPTPPTGGTPSPPILNAAQASSPQDTRPGNGWGDKNHDHTGPPGQNKKSGGG